jgi:demethylmenaquinone methyltransferase/2-methoxy-6-polyprenyl-1,4-benzoquinol methylase
MAGSRDILRDQMAYYEARAAEYDEWFLRRGRYDRGPELNRQWFEEVETVRRALEAWRPQGEVLELACGTGLWTERLLAHADRVTAVDASPACLARNRARVGEEKVVHVCADLFGWEPPRRFDAVFFGFWLSHVPGSRFEEFWDRVGRSVKGSGSVFFVDSRYDATSSARDHELDPRSETMLRRLNDGREFRVVKIFHERGPLTRRLGELGWSFEIGETPRYFLYGSGKPVTK